MRWQFRLLGTLEVWRDGARVPVTAARQRSVLAILALNAGRVVSDQRIVELLWGDRPPPSARHTLHSLVSRLRAVLDPAGGAGGVLSRHSPGYLLRVDPAAVDVHQFRELGAEGLRHLDADEAGVAVADLEAALGLWRGPPLSDIPAEGLLQAYLPALSEYRLAVIERLGAARLRLGSYAEAVPELRAAVAEEPFRESLSHLLMRVLYVSGQQAAALQVYADLRQRLATELGVEPGPALQELHRQILSQDHMLAGPGDHLDRLFAWAGPPRPPHRASFPPTPATSPVAGRCLGGCGGCIASPTGPRLRWG